MRLVSHTWNEDWERHTVYTHRSKAERFLTEGIPYYKWRTKGGEESVPARIVKKYASSSSIPPLVEYRCCVCNGKKNSILGNECCLKRRKEKRRLVLSSIPLFMTVGLVMASLFKVSYFHPLQFTWDQSRTQVRLIVLGER